jgi:TonB family protein
MAKVRHSVKSHCSVTFVLLPNMAFQYERGRVMRWFFAFLVCVSGVTQGAEVFLKSERNPTPIYPPALSRAGFTGSVKVSFVASADGTVSQIRILESDHPDFSEAVSNALKQWRFRPWAVGGGLPAEQEIIAPMVFTLQSPDGVNLWLKDLGCKDVTDLIALPLEYDWVDSAPFHYIRTYLNSTFFQKQISREQRLALISRLNQKVPEIVKACRANPTHKYVDYLPEEIHQLL